MQRYVTPYGGYKYINKKKHCVGCPYHSYAVDAPIPDPFNIPPRDEHHKVTKQECYKDARRDAQLNSDIQKLNESYQMYKSQKHGESPVGSNISTFLKTAGKFCDRWSKRSNRAPKRHKILNFSEMKNAWAEVSDESDGVVGSESDEHDEYALSDESDE